MEKRLLLATSCDEDIHHYPLPRARSFTVLLDQPQLDNIWNLSLGPTVADISCIETMLLKGVWSRLEPSAAMGVLEGRGSSSIEEVAQSMEHDFRKNPEETPRLMVTPEYFYFYIPANPSRKVPVETARVPISELDNSEPFVLLDLEEVPASLPTPT